MFDDRGEGFISVARFREILREIDDEISEEELDGIISDVRSVDFQQINESFTSDWYGPFRYDWFQWVC